MWYPCCISEEKFGCICLWCWEEEVRQGNIYKFYETSFPGVNIPPPVQPSLSATLPWPILEDSHGFEAAREPEVAPPVEVPTRPVRVRRPPDRYGECGRYANLVKEPHPKTYKQAMKSVNWGEWRDAAVKKFESLVGKRTWRLVPRPARRRIIRCKWGFKTETKCLQIVRQDESASSCTGLLSDQRNRLPWGLLTH